MPPERVAVTGAQCFDEWFDWPPRPREEFLARVGLDPGRPFVLYACSVPWTGQSEVEFVRRWLGATGVQAIVRPHPKRAADWAGVDLGEAAVVFPADGHAPTDHESKADFYDSLHHSAAVVALNTSVMIEAAIAGRSVLTIVEPEWERVQQGTLHFVYLLEVAGGLLRVSRTLDEHAAQLGEAVRGADGGAKRAAAFVAEFVRPYGLDVAATPLFVDEVERLAAADAPAPAPHAGSPPAPAAAARAAHRAPPATRRSPTPSLMRIFFQLPYPGYLRIYGSTVALLAEREHTVLLSYDTPDKRREPTAAAVEEREGVTLVPPVPATLLAPGPADGREAPAGHGLRPLSRARVRRLAVPAAAKLSPA